MSTQSRLFQFWQHKELERGKRITVSEVARQTNISRHAIQRLLDNTVTQFDASVLNALCRYFEVPPGPIPFLVYEPDDEV